MACENCEYIAGEIQCQGCADDICFACENGECEASEILANGSVNGHPITPLNNVTRMGKTNGD